MIHIITDSSALFPDRNKAKKELGIDISSLIVTINGQSYKEFDEISSRHFFELILDGGLPRSSQPSIGDLVDMFEQYQKADDEILYLSIADGLSGAFQTALSAKEMCANKDRITVINTRTICGPQHYLVELACKLRDEGKTIPEIVERLEVSMSDCVSFLIPQDFDYLKRNGRLTPIAATLGGLLKIRTVLRETDDGRQLDKFCISRSYKNAINNVINEMETHHYDENYITYISHAFAEGQVLEIKKRIENTFPKLEVIIMELSPSFITQGGPECISIQTIKR